MASVLVGMIVVNIMTLASKTAHDFAYGILENLAAFAIVESVAGLISSRPLLGNSPINVNKTAVKSATVKLMDEKARIANVTAILAAKTQVLIKVNEELGAKHIALAKSYGELDSKHVEMKRVVARNKVVTAKISRQIAARVARSSARSISSMVGKAIPVAGVALMVAMTGLDVKDACDSLKDLNELNVTIGVALEEEKKVCGVRVPTKEAVFEEVKNVKSTH